MRRQQQPQQPQQHQHQHQHQHKQSQQQQYRRKTNRVLIFLGVCIALLTFPYLVYHVSLLRPCSISCTMRRLLEALRSPGEGRQLRVDCRNGSEQLLRAFSLADFHHQQSRGRRRWSRPTYVWLDRPAELPGGCADAIAGLTSTGPPAGDACFNSSYSMDDQLVAYQVVYRVQQNFTERGLEIFMSDGSLLGSLRHFGFIPWDDDIDFMILREQKFEVRELLVQLSHLDEFEFVDTESINYHWRLNLLCQPDRSKPRVPQYGLSRLFPQKTCRISADLFFGEVIGSHFLRPEMPYVYHIEEVYPLKLLPFGPHLMRAPANSRALTAAEYGGDFEFSCMFEVHNPLRLPCREKFHECARLRRLYPFVSHVTLSLGGREFAADILVLQGQALAIFIPPQRPT